VRQAPSASRSNISLSDSEPDQAKALFTGAVMGKLSGMTVEGLDNVGVVVDDLAAALQGD